MRENNLKLGNYFANFFNKKYGFITYSGTLAIEIALKTLLPEKSKVLVSSHVCYSIVNTILKLKMIPVIVVPKNDLFLIDDDVKKSLDKYKINGILLVHQYGIINNINKKEYYDMGIKIIEDVAQIWDINDKNFQVGINSHAVVTSFGKTKPLSYGIGGGIFFDDTKILLHVDYCDNESRENENILLSYGYPLCEEINYDVLINNANKNILEQRNNVKKYCQILNNQKKIQYYKFDNQFSHGWHRFPIWIEDEEILREIVQSIKNKGLEYQLPHEVDLVDLKRNKHCIIINNSQNKKYFILLRTRNIDINKQVDILSQIK